tara:strand:- start:1406 stop:1999 length:594 start_codon:yes stop_codon:yes gene_type:complete
LRLRRRKRFSPPFIARTPESASEIVFGATPEKPVSQKNTSAAKVPTETKPTPLVVGDNTAQLASLTESLANVTSEKDGLVIQVADLRTELANVTSEKDGLVIQVEDLRTELAFVEQRLEGISAASKAAYETATREGETISQPPSPSKMEPRAALRDYDKTELALAAKLGVGPGHILGINVERGVIVTVDGRKLGGAA